MRYLVNYHSVQSDHILATPSYHSSEFVETDSVVKLTEHISNQTDMWGHPYRLNENFGNPNCVSRIYQYISNQGGVIVDEYNEPQFNML
jgi:hypothetical protein